jgi:uncharacterized membrane protein YkgB
VVSESNPADRALEVLDAHRDEARPLLMRWAVVTVALQDLLKNHGKLELEWPEVGSAATRFFDKSGRGGIQAQAPEDSLAGSSRPPARAKLGARASFKARLDAVDRRIAQWMQRWGFQMLRISLAIVYFWFGVLKPLGLSPANTLVTNTVTFISPEIFIPVLGVWECAIGVCLLFRPLVRVALFLLFLQMPGTALPLVLLPDVCFTAFPYAPTLEGQYIIKNLILISAAIVVGGTVRHGKSRALQERVTWNL